MAGNKNKNLWSVLWKIEFAVALLPAAFFTFASGVSYFALLAVELVSKGHAMALKTFFDITVMVVGGVSGLVSIGMAFEPDRLRRNVRLRMIAVAFGCAGILAEILYLQSIGSKEASNPVMLWIFLGPVVVGGHCAYRVFSQHET